MVPGMLYPRARSTSLATTNLVKGAVTETPATVDGVVPNRVLPIFGRLFHVRVAGVKVDVG